MNESIYECPECGKKVKFESGESVPCCGASLNVCTKAGDAEHARLSDMDEPCDDGRGY
jgi:hypothetical protein